jgi:hypothetical protein
MAFARNATFTAHRSTVKKFTSLILMLLATSAGLAQTAILVTNAASTGTTQYETAIVNSSLNAIVAGTSNTTVPTYIVVAGAGTTGQAQLANSGPASCIMDTTIASAAGWYYVVNSTTNAGYCHAQSASPSAGTYVIGYLASTSTTAGSQAQVVVSPSSVPGSGSMVYPGAGIPQSTGSAWGSSLALSALAQTANNLSDLTSPATGRTNLGFASGFTGCTGVTAGDICYYTGSAWNKFGGNTSGTQYLAESSAGSLSWATPTGSGTVNSGTANHLSYYPASSSAVSSDANLDDGATAANTLTYTPAGGIAAQQFSTNASGAGIYQAYNAAGTYYTGWSSAATANNIVQGPATTPTNGDILSATSSGTTMTITDSGVPVSSLVTPSSTTTFTNKSISGSQINSGQVAVSNGGTGVGTLTGIPYGNGTSAFTAATATQAATLISGLTGCSTANYVFTPQGNDCVAQTGGGLSGLTQYVIPMAASSSTIANTSPQLDNTLTHANALTYAGTGGEYLSGSGAELFVGASAPAPTVGTAGGGIAAEGTAFTGISGDDGWYANSTNHCLDVVNGTTDAGCAATATNTLTMSNKTFVAPVLGAATGTSLANTGGVSGQTLNACSDTSGSGTAQSCTTSPATFTPAAGSCVSYNTTTTNSGTGLTVNIDSLGAKSVAIPGSSGWTTTLTASAIPANKTSLMCYDGTNWDLQQTGTSGTGSGAGTVTASAQYDVAYYPTSGTVATVQGAAINGFQFDSTSGAPAAATAANLGTLVGLATSVIPKSGGTTSALAASSISDNGTAVTTSEPIELGTANCTTFGTAGGVCAAEGTSATNVSGTSNLYPDSTAHEWKAATNGSTSYGLINRSQPGAIDSTGLTAAVTTATLCAASAGACNVAGQYHVHINVWGSGTACSSVTAGGVTPSLTWTDENSVSHAAVVVPMLSQTSATAVALESSAPTVPAQTALANEGGSGDFTLNSSGASAIQYAVAYTACTTGTLTYNIRATVTRVQ